MKISNLLMIQKYLTFKKALLSIFIANNLSTIQMFILNLETVYKFYKK